MNDLFYGIPVDYKVSFNGTPMLVETPQKMCPRCDINPACEPEPCPFDEDISGVITPCTCCVDCRNDCARDI